MDIGLLIEQIRPQLRDADQEQRIRQLGERLTLRFESERALGIKSELSHDFNELQKQFKSAIAEVKREAGI